MQGTRLGTASIALAALSWTGATWSCGSDIPTPSTLTRTNVTDFGDWSIGFNAPYLFMTSFECGKVQAWSQVQGL